jgi:metal-responsive CopG/Arc/MetJ family transcriptional regulator
MGAESASGKTRKRSVAKATNRQDAPKEKVTLYLPAELARRFSVHVTYSGMDRSEYFADMVRQHCRRYVVSDRLKEADEVEEKAESEAS